MGSIAIARLMDALGNEDVFAYCLTCNRSMSEARQAEAHEDHGHSVEWDLHGVAA